MPADAGGQHHRGRAAEGLSDRRARAAAGAGHRGRAQMTGRDAAAALKRGRTYPQLVHNSIHTELRSTPHGQDHRHRPGHHQLVRGDHGGQHDQGDREQRGCAHHAVDHRLPGGRRGPGRRVGQAPGGDQPEEHAVRGEAPDRPQVHREGSAEGHRPDALHDRRRRQRRRLGRGARQEAGAAAGQRRGAAQDEEDRRGLSRRRGHRSRDHGAGLLQRQPAPGDQGRRPHRRPRRQAHHQRADRGRARVRPRQARQGRPQDRGLRPRRRHVRHLDHRDRRCRRREAVRSAVDQRRHLPRRRRLRPARDRLHRRRVQEGTRRRPDEGRARAAAPEGGGREGQDRAVQQHADRHQPAVHHGRCVGPEAPEHQAHARQARGAGRGADRAHDRAVPHRDQGRRRQGRPRSTT